jgi:hypothetical protein
MIGFVGPGAMCPVQVMGAIPNRRIIDIALPSLGIISHVLDRPTLLRWVS